MGIPKGCDIPLSRFNELRASARAPCMNNFHVGSSVGQVMDLPSSRQHGKK